MRIVYLYLPGRLPRIPDLKAGIIPTEFFFGAPELEAQGHDIEYIDVHDVPAVNKLRIAVELLLKQKYLPAKVYFSVLFGVKKILPALKGADVVVATVPGIAFSLAILKRLGLVELSHTFIAIHCGLFNYSQSGVRRVLSKHLLRQMHTLLYGEGELEAMKERFQIPDERIEVNCFGVDETFWTPLDGEARDDYVLAVGNDSRRDYELLIQAAGSLNRRVKILTQRELPTNLPENLELVNGSWHTRELSDDDLRGLYRKAFCVVVPLTESIQPSGQSVTLQAMACGTPVILSKTKGLWENKALEHGKNILFTGVGKQQELIDSVRLLEQDEDKWHQLSQGGRQYVLAHGCIRGFADRMEAACRKAIAEEA